MIKATATAASSSGTVSANVNGTITTIRVVAGLTVTERDVMLVEQIGQEWWAVALAYDTTPAELLQPPAPAPPSHPPTVGRAVFSPVETRTYRAGSWTSTGNDSVYQGEYGGTGNKTGCVFYGSAPRSLHGATVTSASIQVRRLRGGVFAAQTATMRLMTQSTRPAGAPTLTSSTTGPRLAVDATNNSFAVPTSWVQDMVDGTAGGLAFFESDGSPYIRFAGRGDWSAAFALTVNWRRD